MGDRFNDGGLKTEASDGISSEDFNKENKDQEIKEKLENPEIVQNSLFENPEYLVRGAKLRCTCGSHARLLNLPLCHGVYHIGHPTIHQKDAKVGDDENITSFGVCSSSLHPQEKLFGENITLIKEKVNEDEPDENVKGAPCTPIIVDVEWKNPEWETLIADNFSTDGSDENIDPVNRTYYPIPTTDSFLVCKYSGLIQPVSSGQENIPETEEEQHEAENISP